MIAKVYWRNWTNVGNEYSNPVQTLLQQLSRIALIAVATVHIGNNSE
jgi:hypothetical protein